MNVGLANKLFCYNLDHDSYSPPQLFFEKVLSFLYYRMTGEYVKNNLRLEEDECGIKFAGGSLDLINESAIEYCMKYDGVCCRFLDLFNKFFGDVVVGENFVYELKPHLSVEESIKEAACIDREFFEALPTVVEDLDQIDTINEDGEYCEPAGFIAMKSKRLGYLRKYLDGRTDRKARRLDRLCKEVLSPCGFYPAGNTQVRDGVLYSIIYIGRLSDYECEGLYNMQPSYPAACLLLHRELNILERSDGI